MCRKNEYTRREPKLWRYDLPGGWEVLVGRTEADNDQLSLKIADPDDYWFHVNGMPGSHTILRSRPNEEPGRDTLKSAAAIAAWHSKARARRSIGVSCTQARYVTKPRGAKPGSVSIRREKTLTVKPELPEIRYRSL